MKVFLTGATGLIGSHVAEAMARRGDRVIALVRETSDTTHLDALDVRTVVGDLTDSIDTLAAAMRGVDAVVHAAAMVYPGVAWPRIRQVNVEGTRRIGTAAARTGVPRLVHISSVSVYGGVREPVDESAPIDTPIPPGDLYARSKRESEIAARDAVAETDTSLVVLRPSVVYGARDRLFAPKLLRLAHSPLIPLAGSGRTTLPVVHAANVASAVTSAVDHEKHRERAVPRIYNVGEDHPIGMRRLLELFAEAAGRSPTFLPIPAAVVRAGARAIERLGIGIPGAPELPPSRAAALATSDNPYRTDRLRRELAWVPAVGHPEGVRETVEWIERGNG